MMAAAVARIYVAGPLFTPQDRQALAAIAQAVAAQGHTPVLPHDETGLDHVAGPEAAAERQRTLLRLLEGCDAVVALLDGVDADGGTSFELGYAAALNRPVLGLRSDVRQGGESQGVNLMVAGAVGRVVRIEAWTPAALARPVKDFLDGVRVFAGRLVRDGVPRMAKQRGHPIKFDQVASDAMPRVLKRRVVESARRLEATEFGVEQEELADLLELLEALIRVRNYDKESLRAIKEGVWRKRGGYEKGYVVDEEPTLT
jgi:nucleoside 2-deoxyribosyltransferase/predicted house-cleaning noncanonical NTP pyrophosphatase (MazG superfamily)